MTPAPKTTAAAPRRRESAPKTTAAGAPDMRAAFTTKPDAEKVVNTSFNFPETFHRHLKIVSVQQGKSMRDVLMESVLAQHPMD